MGFSAAGIVYGHMEHHLDHLAPLCSLLQIPLIVTEESTEILAKKYYPELDVLFWEYREVAQKVVASFGVVFSTLPRPLFDDAFLLAQILLKKQVKTIWVPHGNSDKGQASGMMEGLRHDQAAVVYGAQMIEFLKAQKSYHQLQHCFCVGNYRLHYYRTHHSFYTSIIQEFGWTEKKIALYAPTWNDAESPSSLSSALPHLMKALPNDWRLVVKPHPNEPAPLVSHPQVTILHHFPPIYPLLDAASIYIGDRSSIGYDFLSFRRPMFFFHPDPSLFLFQCGTVLRPEDSDQIFSQVHHNPFASIQSSIYENVFGSSNQWEKGKANLMNFLSNLLLHPNSMVFAKKNGFWPK